MHIPEADELWVVSTGGPATDDGLIEAVDLVNGVSDRVLLREDRLPGNLEGLAYIQPDIAYVLSAGGLYLWNPMTGTLSDTALATGLSRGVYSHDGVVYAWGESGMRLFDGVSGMELTSGSPIVFGSRR